MSGLFEPLKGVESTYNLLAAVLRKRNSMLGIMAAIVK